MARWLLVDIGNSYTKFASAETDTGIGKIYYVQLDELIEQIPDADGVIVSCVADSNQLLQLALACQNHDVPFHTPDKIQQGFGVQFAYEEINNLGIDRWINIIAGHHKTDGDAVVISLGTAITCDFIKADGRHLGGWISPGLQLLRQTLLKNTAKIIAEESSFGFTTTIGTSTQTCVDAGCKAALEGAVMRAISEGKRQFGCPTILVTGGDRELVAGMDCAIILVENLVVDGLYRVLRTSVLNKNERL